MPLMSLTWHVLDDEACHICMPLDGHVWTFDTEKDGFPSQIYHPKLGIVVWDCDKDKRRPHGEREYHCRCWLTVNWDFNDVEDRINSIKAHALATCGSLEVWSGGTQVRVIRDQGRFVSWRKTM